MRANIGRLPQLTLYKTRGSVFVGHPAQSSFEYLNVDCCGILSEGSSMQEETRPTGRRLRKPEVVRSSVCRSRLRSGTYGGSRSRAAPAATIDHRHSLSYQIILPLSKEPQRRNPDSLTSPARARIGTLSFLSQFPHIP